MKYKYKKYYYDSSKNLYCYTCKELGFIPDRGFLFFYITSFGVICKQCIEKLENTEPDWAIGLEAMNEV